MPSPLPVSDHTSGHLPPPVHTPRPLRRRRVNGFVCHLALELTDSDLRSLVSAVAERASGTATGPDRSGLDGRTATWLHDIPSVGPVMIKEYRRGGMLRHLRRRHYLRHGATRPERELRAMRLAHAIGVNVPEAVASLTRGLLFYRGWLATRHIAGTTLAALKSDPVTLASLMSEMTRQVRLLIAHRLAHVDLHPGNVLIDTGGALYLLDFDKATVFKGTPEELRELYLVRWARSVTKHGLPAFLADRFREGLDSIPV